MSNAAALDYMRHRAASFVEVAMAAEPWVCSARKECCDRAVKIVLNVTSYLHSDPPYLMDRYPIPVCGKLSCETETENMPSKDVLKDRGMVEVLYNGVVCDKSGKKREFSLSDHIHSKHLEKMRACNSDQVEYLQLRGADFNRQVIAAGPWLCSCREQCSARATGTVLTPMAYLHNDPPFIFDCNAIPKCRDPLCEIAGKQDTKRFLTAASKEIGAAGTQDRSLYSAKMRLCACCGALDAPDRALRKCTRCEVVYYCDKDCQKTHWKQHKQRCLPA
jgi:hypothetical protein